MTTVKIHDYIFQKVQEEHADSSRDYANFWTKNSCFNSSVPWFSILTN